MSLYICCREITLFLILFLINRGVLAAIDVISDSLLAGVRAIHSFSIYEAYVNLESPWGLLKLNLTLMNMKCRSFTLSALLSSAWSHF